jgi:hypothetical protein
MAALTLNWMMMIVMLRGRNKNKPNGNKKASSLRDQVDDMFKSKEKLVHKTLEIKIIITEKKIEEKRTR